MNKLKDVFFNIYKLIFRISGILFPKNNNFIIFESFLGKQYSDNPRAIYEYLKSNYPHLTLYWSVDKHHLNSFEKLDDVLYTKRFSIKWLFLMTRAKYWVSNSRLPLWIPKPAKTIYLQTWHGTPLKKLATDMDEVHMPGTNTDKYKRNFVTESNKWDYLISPNEYSTAIFKRAFQFNKTIIESGYPRNDFLINHTESMVTSIKNNLNLPKDKKIILYAPTWRDDDFKKKGHYNFSLPFNIDKLEKKLSDDYIIILRLHYLVAEKIDLSAYPNFIIDHSYYEDIRDLYLISDLLITDYSSVFFDYANLQRPMIFYVHDIDNYRDKLRGFYFDFETKAPGPLVKTTENLIHAIRRTEDKDYPLKKYQKDFKAFTILEDGQATKRVVEEVFTHLR